jgi:hypothetical protein
MKKLILCITCAFLLGGAVQALKFKNTLNIYAAPEIIMDESDGITVPPGKTVSKNDTTWFKIREIKWTKSSRVLANCPIKGVLRLDDNKTISIVELSADKYECRLED